MVLEIKCKKNKIATKNLFPIKNPSGFIPSDQFFLSSLVAENLGQMPVGIVGLYRPVLKVSY